MKKKNYMYSFMRCLESQGYFSSEVDGSGVQRWKSTVKSSLLCSGDDKLRSLLMIIAQPPHYQPWGRVADVVREGRCGAELAFDGVDSVWKVFARNPHWQSSFDKAMSSLTVGALRAVKEVVQRDSLLDKTPCVMDVGGGHGVLLAQLLQTGSSSNPAMRGICFDQPHVADAARASPSPEIAKMGGDVAARISFVGGDFFAERSMPALPAGSVIVMKHILHDWDDTKCGVILACCHQALSPGDRLFVFEQLLDADAGNPMAAIMDMNMMMVPGGRERTRKEFESLLRTGGFKLDRVTNCSPMMSLLIAKRI